MAEVFAGLVEGLSKVIGGFDNKELAFGIALAILAMAVMIGVFLHLRRHRPWIQPVRRLSAKLKKLRGSDLDADERLIEADHAFESEAHLAPLWQEYRKHLQPNPQVPGYLNLVDPRLWFSVESLPGRGYEHWCATWAGIFLTVGLLFTFIGLSAALLKVGDISGADSQTMKDAITGILKVSSAKFITSVAGLIAYIGFSLVTSRYHSSQQAAVKELADAVQHLSVPLTPELLLYEQNHTARKQLTRMERLTDDLAVAIDGKLEQRLKILAADFGRHVDVIRQDSALADVLTEIKNVLTEIKNGMGGMSQEFGSEIKEAAASLAQAAKAMGQGFQVQSAELDQKIGEFGGKLKSITGTLDQIPNNISRALNETMKQCNCSLTVGKSMTSAWNRLS